MAILDIRVQSEDFDLGHEVEKIREHTGEAGAIVTFSGLCRSEGGKLEALELEHYPGMAEAEIERIASEAAVRWPVNAVTVVHRFGKMSPGDNIVLVVTASIHRHAAFDAASFLMDFMKNEAPFWKREIKKGASSDSWVSSRPEDDEAARRWNS